MIRTLADLQMTLRKEGVKRMTLIEICSSRKVIIKTDKLLDLKLMSRIIANMDMTLKIEFTKLWWFSNRIRKVKKWTIYNS